MHRGPKATLPILALVIAAVAVFPAPVAATDDPLTIQVTTTLTENHLGSIIIGADGITLDCAGHTVSGIGSGTGINLTERTGVTIKNCQVTGFRVGFNIVSSSHNTLTKNTANGNVVHGFLLITSTDNTLTKNEANDNGSHGFFLISSSGNTLTKNAACGTGDVDALQVDSSGNVFVDNDFCTTSGIP